MINITCIATKEGVTSVEAFIDKNLDGVIDLSETCPPTTGNKATSWINGKYVATCPMPAGTIGTDVLTECKIVYGSYPITGQEEEDDSIELVECMKNLDCNQLAGESCNLASNTCTTDCKGYGEEVVGLQTCCDTNQTAVNFLGDTSLAPKSLCCKKGEYLEQIGPSSYKCRSYSGCYESSNPVKCNVLFDEISTYVDRINFLESICVDRTANPINYACCPVNKFNIDTTEYQLVTTY